MTTTACATKTATGAQATGDSDKYDEYAAHDDSTKDPVTGIPVTTEEPTRSTASRDTQDSQDTQHTQDSQDSQDSQDHEADDKADDRADDDGADDGDVTAEAESGPGPTPVEKTVLQEPPPRPTHPPTTPSFAITANGSYAARLAPRRPESEAETETEAGDLVWCPERWTLDGPEPYAVPLPLDQPEEYGTEVLPMADGRVLVHRTVGERQSFSLLYPTGPGTGEHVLGALECEQLRLLPPSPSGSCAYALAVGPHSSAVWLVAGGAFGPERVAEVPGRCSGGVWLDRTGRMLAIDQELDGRTKTVSLDLERGGEVAPLLQIAEESNDRLLLADAASGLILVRSDAPGHDRIGWGVLGSTLPIRFPECLRLEDCAVTPFAIQPGQALMPEHCAVALRIDGAAGTWIGLWRPVERCVQHMAAPAGWLTGSGLLTPEGELRLPYATEAEPCGVARVMAPPPAPPRPALEPVPAAPRPVPLQQAPLQQALLTRRFARRVQRIEA